MTGPGRAQPSEATAAPTRLARLQRLLDDFQLRHPALGFPNAVIRKYLDDGGSRLAALLTYYGFLSLFPAMVLLVFGLQSLFRNHPSVPADLIERVVPPEFQQQVLDGVQSLPTSGVPLAVGLIGLVFAGIGGVFAATIAVNQIWAVPFRLRFRLGARYLRGLAALLVVLFGVAATGALGLLTTSVFALPTLARVSSGCGTFAVAFLLLMAGPPLLARRPPRPSENLLGSLLGAAVVLAVIAVGSPLLGRLVANAGPLYGPLATIIGLFTLLFLAAQGLILAGEVSVVHAWGLWPRSMIFGRVTPADERAYRILARMDERRPPQRNTASFDRPTGEGERSGT